MLSMCVWVCVNINKFAKMLSVYHISWKVVQFQAASPNEWYGMERKGNACNAYEMICPACCNIARCCCLLVVGCWLLLLLLIGCCMAKYQKLVTNTCVMSPAKPRTHSHKHTIVSFLEWDPTTSQQQQKEIHIVHVFSIINVPNRQKQQK